MHMDERIGDGWVFIGSLGNLSFGYQSRYEAIKQYLKESGGILAYYGRKVMINISGIY